jgi:hypothetical protein
MRSAIGNQSDLSTTYKPKVTKAKSANREESKWEKGEVSQLIFTAKFLKGDNKCYRKDRLRK